MIQLADRWDPQARGIPGAFWDRDTGSWVLREEDLTPRSATVTLKLYPELALKHPQLEAERDKLIQDVRPFDNATPFDSPIEAPFVRAALENEGKAFYRFQELDLGYLAAVLHEHGAGYLGWERGLGKTLGTLALIDELDCQHSLIVCPNTAKQAVWAAECERFLPKHECVVLPNPKRRRENCLAHVRYQVENSKVPLILVVHYEALAIIAGKRGEGWRRLVKFDLTVADEAHRIKNPNAKMSRAIKKVPSTYRLALSGSIIENHADELFSPLQWLFPDRYRSKWRDWNDRFLDYVDGGYSKVFVGIKLDRLKELREELGVFMVYRRKEDELDLPERTDQTLLVDLTTSQRKVYKELEDECLTRLEDDTLVFAQEGLPMLTKLRQVATGLDLLGEVQDSSKLDLTIDMIEDNADEAFVVFSWYKAAVRELEGRLEQRGVECFVVDGDVTQDKRNERIARFQEGDARVFIGTLATLGESVNLYRANNAIFLDRSWNPATNVQAADRIYRIGQDKPVTITHLVAKDTVDEHRVLPTIKTKEALRKLILGGTNE